MYSLPLATLVAVLVALATHVHQVSCQLDDEYNILSRQLRPKVYLKRFTKLYCKSTKESLVNFEECFASYYERIFDHVYRKHEMDDARAMVAYCFKASSPMARREKQCKKNKMKADYGMDKVNQCFQNFKRPLRSREINEFVTCTNNALKGISNENDGEEAVDGGVYVVNDGVVMSGDRDRDRSRDRERSRDRGGDRDGDRGSKSESSVVVSNDGDVYRNYWSS